MQKVLSFLKPSLGKLSLFLIWWVIFYLVFIYLFKACIFADCRNFKDELIPCCNQTMTAMAQFFYRHRNPFLALIYLFSCWLSTNLENVGTISHRARQL
ncbi:hypothetical protein L6250_03790 [Candidatus Parcubacteria bacterium]|nr:hypothetical protein [Patescibacteria group bacterium]MBU4466842.1 hypothetical protein [Patescibacteria group bacterium]MCG2688723.1 hypothetical protein [Candidatus Parcubacteria bacterium]